MILTAAQVLWR